MESEKPIVFMGVDIGGTLAKLAIFVPIGAEVNFSHLESLRIDLREGSILFARYENDDLSPFFTDMKKIKENFKLQTMFVTGGGSFKYQEELREIDPQFAKVQEMNSLVRGFNFLDKFVDNYSFTYRDVTGYSFDVSKKEFPYLLVNIGSGVSILRFDSDDKYERIGGTPIGGGTFLGMCNMMIGVNNFDELLAMAKKGQSGNADLLIKDIYKRNLYTDESDSQETVVESKQNLAVSLGKLSYQHLNKSFQFKPEDMAKSFLILVAFNISQLAYFYAKIHNAKMIYFAGNFIRGHEQTMECISEALTYFSENTEDKKKAIFLNHDGYLGALAGLAEAFEASNFTVTHI